MRPSEDIQEIQDLLRHEYLRERRKGIEKAAALLAQGLYREPLREMLAETASGDLANNLAELAQQVLDEDQQRQASHPRQYESGEGEHMVGAVCPQGHPNYYDKRILCGGEIRFRRVVEAGIETDDIIVKCQTAECSQEMKIKVDCEGYK